jgi:hypothetical protein
MMLYTKMTVRHRQQCQEQLYYHCMAGRLLLCAVRQTPMLLHRLRGYIHVHIRIRALHHSVHQPHSVDVHKQVHKIVYAHVSTTAAYVACLNAPACKTIIALRHSTVAACITKIIPDSCYQYCLVCLQGLPPIAVSAMYCIRQRNVSNCCTEQQQHALLLAQTLQRQNMHCCA